MEGVFHRIKERLLEYCSDQSLINIKDDYIAVKLKVKCCFGSYYLYVCNPMCVTICMEIPDAPCMYVLLF